MAISDDRDFTAKKLSHSTWSWALPLGVMLLYAVFLAARLASRGWDPSACLCASEKFCTRSELPVPLQLHTDGAAYDGQFFYRLGLAPWDLRPVAHGIRFDWAAYRAQRIGYPVVCWLASCGRAAWLAPAMLLVNLLWLGVLAWVLVRWLRALGIAEVWALLPCLWPGLLLTLGRDLSEIQETTLLLLGCWLLFRGRAGLGAALLAGAVLTRETALLPMAGLFGFFMWQALYQRQRVLWVRAAWLLLPLLGALGWQWFLWRQFAIWPMLEVSRMSSAVAPIPGSGLLAFLVHGLPFVPLIAPPSLLGFSAAQVQMGYRLFSMAALGLVMLALVALIWNWRAALAPTAFKWVGLLAFGVVLLQAEANWQLGPSAFLRIANAAAVCGLLVAATAPRPFRRALLGVLLVGWLASWPYVLSMP
jgi:hypothetical protein